MAKRTLGWNVEAPGAAGAGLRGGRAPCARSPTPKYWICNFPFVMFLRRRRVRETGRGRPHEGVPVPL
ncbi:hypothetical protein EVAR_24553_1 [Eumeta japonica]|uniref:Uncharacterized protein n=1 Tax=Eumeta variegata TaxID=151549 RepID=A0A4C1US80_EUMVA|nr:hypothetical protein EVAR_24553_1 [Eumeta japonica]